MHILALSYWCTAMQVTSDCPPSLFAYPPPVTTEAKDTGAKVPKAVLSTTAKAKDKAKKKEAERAVKEGRATDHDKEANDKPESKQTQPRNTSSKHAARVPFAL